MTLGRLLLGVSLVALVTACSGDDKETGGGQDSDSGDTGDSGDSGDTADTTETGDTGESGETGDTDTGDTGVVASDVFAIQRGEVAAGTSVSLNGLVLTSPNTGFGFFAQDPAGGAYSGIWIYYGDVTDTTLADAFSILSQGQVVDLSGTVNEYSASGGTETLTELIVADGDTLSVVTVQAPPAPIELTTAELADPVAAEPYESTLVRVSDVAVVNGDLGYGEWSINDGVIVDDLFYDLTEDVGELATGDSFTTITGPFYFSYDVFKIVPRDASDIEGYLRGPLVCAADLCADMLSHGDLVLSEVMPNPDTCADPNGEYFEVYNNSGQSVDLYRLTLQDGTGSYEVDETVVVGAGEYFWLANGTFTTDYCYLSAGDPDFYYASSLQLGNEGDSLSLAWVDGSLETVIDTITYSEASVARGVAYALNPDTLDADANDDEANWCAQSSTIGSTADFGTPGSANDVCPEVSDTGVDTD